MDDNADALREAILKDNLVWFNISDLKGQYGLYAQVFGVSAIPQNILVNPNGKIVFTSVSAAQLEKNLHDQFKVN